MTAEKPRIPVSLILTTRNEAANVPLFLEGVRAQTVRPAEIVVCDGGSTDDTAELLQRLGADLPLHLVVEPGANIARGRNCAIRASTQDVLAITDAGCIIDAEWLERITGPLLQSLEVDAVGGGYALIGDTRVQRWTRASSLPFEQQDPGDFLPSSRSFAVRRAAIEGAGLYPEHLTFAGEDTALVLRMREQGARFVTQWDALVHWYPRATLRAFLRQHYLYGLGDGEARNSGNRYFRTAIKWSFFVGLLFTALIDPWLLLLLPAALLAYAFHLAPIYHWGTLPPGERIGGFIFIALKEWSMSAGYLVGRVRGAPGRRA